MRYLQLLLLVGLMALAGCGEEKGKVADKPSEEQIKKMQDAEKQVADEERGTPVKGKK